MSATQNTAVQSPARYDAFSITLHWLTAILVVSLFLMAELWGFLPRPARHLAITLHMSLGILLIATLAIRVIWRLLPGHPMAAPPGLAGMAAKAMHHMLYVLLALQMGLGIMLRWTDNQALSFFGLLIASPFGVFSRTTGNIVHKLHDLDAWTLMVLAGGHAAMALFHHFIMNDAVLARMLPGLRGRPIGKAS